MSKYTKQDIMRLVEEEDIEFIRLQFTDMFGTLKNLMFCEYQQCLNTMFKQTATEPWMANWRRWRIAVMRVIRTIRTS